MHIGCHQGIHYAMGYCGSGVGMGGYLGMRIGQQVLGLPEGRTAFRQRFKEIYGYDPHRIAPLGYDAAALAILLAQTPTGPDFGAKALLDQRGFFGTEGIFRFSPDGTAERGLAVLEIGGAGAVVVADPAPQRFPSGTTAGGGVMPDDATNATPPPPSSGQ